jgi:hypothetical protein
MDVDAEAGGAHPLPSCAYRYFWDVDPAQLDVVQYSTYVIERLLEYGDLPAVRWMLEAFPREAIVQALQRSRALSRRSANFWAIYLNVEEESVPCLSKPSRRESDTIWPG